MPEDSGGEKSLPPSPIKRRKAREKGNVAKSQDLASAWSLAVALLTLHLLGPTMFENLHDAANYYFSSASDMLIERGSAQYVGLTMIWHLGRLVAPFMIIMALAGVLVNLFQVGFLYAPTALAPDFGKINPIKGVGRFFSIRSLFELVKSLSKLGLIGFIVYLTLRGRWDSLMITSFLKPVAVAYAVWEIIFVMWFRVVLLMAVLGLLDYAFQRWRYEQDLRMTQQEAKEEMKEMEGDPRVKQRVRQIQRQAAMQRMMGEIPAAEVVVTNPTTYAVAIRYDVNEMDAPVVVAKGMRLLAQRIREKAVEHDVPIIEKPELARALYKQVEVGDAIPEDLYRTVAEVLKFVFEIDKRVEKVRERQQYLNSIRAAAG
jgi:flagellar biosynthetic protein FlhB